MLCSILCNAQDRISGDEKKRGKKAERAFIVLTDNEAEWLLYDGAELSKLIRLSLARLLMDFLCSPKYTRCQHQDLEISRSRVFYKHFRFKNRLIKSFDK